MKPEAQRIAIAEACGWTCSPRGDVAGWINPQEKTWAPAVFLPNYLNDLNAMHEAEKVLTYEQVNLFVTHLRGFTPAKNWEGCWGLHATAAQRAEAFLKAINLWDDSK